MSVDLTGVVHNVLSSLTENVFGNMILTCVILMVVVVIFALLIRIPLPFAFAINIPMSLVLTAYGYLPAVVGGLLAVGFLIFAVVSFLGGLGIEG